MVSQTESRKIPTRTHITVNYRLCSRAGTRLWSRPRGVRDHKKRAVMFFGWLLFLISSRGHAPHVRTPHVGPQYVRGARHNRIDPHGGGIERLRYGTTTNGTTAFINASTCNFRYRPDNPPVVFDLPARARKWSGNIFRVGIFLDFVRRSGTTRAEGPHGAHVRRAERNRIDRRPQIILPLFFRPMRAWTPTPAP